jgi:hypothetical protein
MRRPVSNGQARGKCASGPQLMQLQVQSNRQCSNQKAPKLGCMAIVNLPVHVGVPVLDNGRGAVEAYLEPSNLGCQTAVRHKKHCAATGGYCLFVAYLATIQWVYTPTLQPQIQRFAACHLRVDIFLCAWPFFVVDMENRVCTTVILNPSHQFLT